MSRKRIDVTGQKFKKLTALYPEGSHWICVCECGKHIKKRLKDLTKMLKKQDHQGCGCGKGLIDKEARINNFIYNYKYGAKTRSLEFSLDDEHIRKLMFDKCYYCDREPYYSYNKSKKQYKGKELIANGIDRIDNSKGYLIENVVTSCKECNILRSNKFTQEETKVMVLALKNFRESKKP